jgi:hypothetical protein
MHPEGTCHAGGSRQLAHLLSARNMSMQIQSAAAAWHLRLMQQGLAPARKHTEQLNNLRRPASATLHQRYTMLRCTRDAPGPATVTHKTAESRCPLQHMLDARNDHGLPAWRCATRGSQQEKAPSSRQAERPDSNLHPWHAMQTY